MRLGKYIVEGFVHQGQVCVFEILAQLLCRDEMGRGQGWKQEIQKGGDCYPGKT